MNFVSQSFIELARGGRLFAGAVDVNTPISDHELATNSYVYVKMAPGDIAEAMVATPWVSAQTFKKVGDGAPAEYTVINTARQVFICMHSPGVASTSEPNRLEAREVMTADGYIWRYLFTVPEAISDKFAWSGLTPVGLMEPAPVTTFDVSALSLRSQDAKLTFYPAMAITPSRVVENQSIAAITVPYGKIPAATRRYVKVEPASSTGQAAVLAITIEAGTLSVSVVEQGTGYGAGAVVKVFGDGTGAKIGVVVNAGKVVAASVVAQGAGYSWADAIVVDGGDVVAAVNVDYEKVLDRKYTIISKDVPLLDPSSEQVLDLHYFLSEAEETNARVRGHKGSLLVGVSSKTVFHFLAECKPSSFRLSQEMLINTVITSG